MDKSALLNAALSDDLLALRLALGAGEDPCTQLPSGRTALHLAVASGRSDLASALLFAGADALAVDGLGRSSIELERRVIGTRDG